MKNNEISNNKSIFILGVISCLPLIAFYLFELISCSFYAKEFLYSFNSIRYYLPLIILLCNLIVLLIKKKQNGFSVVLPFLSYSIYKLCYFLSSVYFMVKYPKFAKEDNILYSSITEELIPLIICVVAGVCIINAYLKNNRVSIVMGLILDFAMIISVGIESFIIPLTNSIPVGLTHIVRFVLLSISFVLVIIELILMDRLQKSNNQDFNSNNQNENIFVELNTDNKDLLIKYKELLDIGAITQEEFDTKKKELLNL